VFAGSEDFSVLMFRPSLPQNQDVTAKPTTSIARRNPSQRRIVKLQKAEGAAINFTQVLAVVFIVLAVIIMVILGYGFLKKRPKNITSPPATITLVQGTESAQTIFDLETVVNSVMGISKHAAYLIDNSALAKVKKIAAGGGGELFLSKVMDPVLKKKIPETVVQKIVFVKNKVNEEAFYQEVGIMILLNTFPYFCQIIGYTENPLSMVLKNYPDGSLYDWASKNHYGKRIILKILKETASALSVMHSHYLAHCDLKPQNILLEVENGIPTCFLTDFGITQILSEKIIATKAFHVMNLRGLSVHYASPEALSNFRSKKYSRTDFKKYDIYSFAVLTLEVVTRKTPWSTS
jgi:serine/threonine protein kinase